jgi:hypothetical protein
MAEVRTEETEAGHEVRALRFTLVDERGVVRATLGPGVDATIGMRLYDAEGRPRAELALDASGTTNLKLHDAEGEVCASLAVAAHGSPGLYLRGASGHREGVRGHTEISVDQHGCPVLSLHDRDGQPRVLLGLDDQTGRATLSYADTGGNPCVLLTEEGDGGRLHLFRRDGRARDVPVLPIGPYAAPTDASESPAPAPVPVTDPAPRPRGRIRRAALVVAGLLVGAFLGKLTARVGPEPVSAPGPVAAPSSDGGVVRTEELVLTDHDGAVRARLSVLPDGTPLLWMTDPAGKSSAQLSVLADAGAQLRLSGGRSTIVLTTPPGEPPSLGAYTGTDVLFQAPSHVARFLPLDLFPPEGTAPKQPR